MTRAAGPQSFKKRAPNTETCQAHPRGRHRCRSGAGRAWTPVPWVYSCLRQLPGWVRARSCRSAWELRISGASPSGAAGAHGSWSQEVHLPILVAGVHGSWSQGAPRPAPSAFHAPRTMCSCDRPCAIEISRFTVAHCTSVVYALRERSLTATSCPPFPLRSLLPSSPASSPVLSIPCPSPSLSAGSHALNTVE